MIHYYESKKSSNCRPVVYKSSMFSLSSNYTNTRIKFKSNYSILILDKSNDRQLMALSICNCLHSESKLLNFGCLTKIF